MLTNESVQAHLSAAVEKLDSMAKPADEVDATLFGILRNSLHCARLFSASGNPVPGLGGKGLQEAMDLATKVLAEDFRADRIRPGYKHLMLAFI